MNRGAAMRAFAARRRCPCCGRGNALSNYGTTSQPRLVCHYADCGYPVDHAPGGPRCNRTMASPRGIR